MIRLLERIPAVAHWSADREFARLTGRRLPPHIKVAGIDRSTGVILFRCDGPVDHGGWLEGWNVSTASGFDVGMSKILYPGWYEPSRAFYRVDPKTLVALWVLADDNSGRGMIRIV